MKHKVSSCRMFVFYWADKPIIQKTARLLGGIHNLVTCQSWWWWLFPRMPGFWENVWQSIPYLCFFFSFLSGGWLTHSNSMAHAHLFHSLGQDKSTDRIKQLSIFSFFFFVCHLCDDHILLLKPSIYSCELLACHRVYFLVLFISVSKLVGALSPVNH